MAFATPADPVFSRGDVAKILNITPLTIANREKAAKYPPPTRDLNNYRIYSLVDVVRLQHVTNHSSDPRPIVSLLYDKGYRDIAQVTAMVETAQARVAGS